MVALAVAGRCLNANGALPVAFLLWPVLLVERPGRRCEATIAYHPWMAVSQGIHITHASSFEPKLTCGLAFFSLV